MIHHIREYIKTTLVYILYGFMSVGTFLFSILHKIWKAEDDKEMEGFWFIIAFVILITGLFIGHAINQLEQ